MSGTVRLGMFIVAMLVIFAAGVFVIGSKQFLFSSTYHLNAQFRQVSGLIEGAEVRVGGIREGTVKHIVLPRQPDGNVTVVMDLNSITHDVIKKDSRAAIASEGLLGDKYVEVSFGSKEAEKVKDGDTIASEPPLELSALMHKTDQILDTAKQAMAAVSETADNLSSISAKINRGSGSIGRLVNDKQLYQRVDAGTAAFSEDMEALKHNFLLRGFFKKRGYEDSEELKRHEISQLPEKPYARKFAYEAKQIFDKPDTAKLKHEKVLNEAGKFLEDGKYGLVVVAGYAGMKGDTQKAHQLTQARSMVVRDYLVRNFRLDDTKIKTIGLGKSGAVEDPGRVEILVYP